MTLPSVGSSLGVSGDFVCGAFSRPLASCYFLYIHYWPSGAVWPRLAAVGALLVRDLVFSNFNSAAFSLDCTSIAFIGIPFSNKMRVGNVNRKPLTPYGAFQELGFLGTLERRVRLSHRH